MGFLSTGPRIRKEDGKLVARTGLAGTILTLGAAHREVTVDPKRRQVVLRRRLGWFFGTERVIPFDRISRLVYTYSDANPATALGLPGDTLDCYTVKLVLTGSQEVRLFRFIGEGGFENRTAIPDWYYWEDRMFDMVGSQGQESRTYVRLLEAMLGLQVSSQ
jgi:hypothetical protein